MNSSLGYQPKSEERDYKTVNSQFNKNTSQSSIDESNSNAIQIPSITLPKGGGAIKSIDEKFQVNAVNGTASFSIPLPASQARGVTPTLSVSYNSGSGNGIFGLGWSLSLPSIKRKTDKQLPQYFDDDVFLFSEAEDLVPVYQKEFKKDAEGNFLLDDKGNKIQVFSVNQNGEYIFKEIPSADANFTIRFYKPRVEGLFARIERWTTNDGSEVKWRVITKENITTLFGWSALSRITDPTNATRIYEWLPEFVFDDKGNCCVYHYKPEDNTNFDVSLLHNRNRLDKNGNLTYTNLYIDKVLYCNSTPYKQFGDAYPLDLDFLFELAFDYGTLNKGDNPDVISVWDFRLDAFSDYKPGFELRTTRLCKRALLFHHFDSKKEEYNGLVKSINFEYDTSSEQDFTFLKSITSVGYNKDAEGNYTLRGFPPFEFYYQKHEWNSEVKTVVQESLVNAPTGIDQPPYQFVDLFNEGISGILTEQATGWYYKHNLGERVIESDNNSQLVFEEAKLVSPKPSFAGLGSQLQLLDLDADGRKQLVSYSTEPKGYFELDDNDNWQPYQNFTELPNINFNDPFTRMIDLNGDGKAELLISKDEVFTWYESEGRIGFKEAVRTSKPFNEEAGPYMVFADEKQTIFLADMSGDGLTDIVRIRNGEVCYWPNLGYGKFGSKVAMENAPVFDAPDAFNPAYLKLADIDGSGTTDIIYLGLNKFTCWKNLNGNSFSTTAYEIDAFPEIHSNAKVTVTDLLGTGTICIVWSSSLAKDATAPLKYIDLMNSKKPHIMVEYLNNMGKKVCLEYTPSTKFYIDDKLAGTPWITKLHFPVQCVSKTIAKDIWQKTTFSNQYSYHHGYYDHAEREFRGFGRVDQVDCETFGEFDNANANSPYITKDKTLYEPPVLTKTWFHLGTFFNRENILSQFAHEYFAPAPENNLPEPDLQNNDLTAVEWREALRSCKGMTLRQEIYELDVYDLENKIYSRTKLFSTAHHNCNIQLLQPVGQNAHAIFLITESEAITYNYELPVTVDHILNTLQPSTTPDPRIVHTLNLSIDDVGNVIESVAIAYKRTAIPSSLLINTITGNIIEQFGIITSDGYANYLPGDDTTRLNNLLSGVQQEQHLIFTVNTFTKDINDDVSPDYRLRMPCETKTYELTGIDPYPGFYFSIEELRNKNLSTTEELAYHQQANNTTRQKRLIEQTRVLYFKDDLQHSADLKTLNKRGLVYEKYQLALTAGLLTDIMNDQISGLKNAGETNDDVLSRVLVTQGGYAFIDGMWWMRSGIAGFAGSAADHFYLPEKYTDAFGNPTNLHFDTDYYLYLKSSDDAVGNHTQVLNFDFRVLAPLSMKDMNDNQTDVIYDVIGVPAALAVIGNNESGDDVSNIETDIDEATLINFFTENYDKPHEAQASSFLQKATVRYVYYLGEVTTAGTLSYENHPVCAASIAREMHVFQLADSPLQTSFQYTDGSGNVLVSKTQAEPENGDGFRWIANGKTILNNKGKPVKKYEPYFTDNQMFEELKEMGVAVVMYYDSAGRLVRTDMPDGSYSRVEFTPWFSAVFDQNDTLLEAGNEWYDANKNLPDVNKQNAANAAAIHANTPTLSFFDSLGRNVISIAHNKWKARDGSTKDEKYFTYTKLDAEGKPLWILDGRNNRVMQYIFPYKQDNITEAVWNPVYFPCYDIAGNVLFQHSMDGGDRWMLNDCTGKPMYAWDSRQHRFFTEYDELHRPTNSWLFKEDTAENILVGIEVYGENVAYDKQNKLRGKVFQHYDQSGRVTNASYDFKGNLLTVDRLLTKETKTGGNYADEFDWNVADKSSLLEDEKFEQNTQYDALNRMIQLDSWHTTNAASVYNVPASTYLPEYNKRGLLSAEKLYVRGVVKKTPESNYIISDITYDAKGQKQQVKYGNNTVTKYTYDTNTFRLIELTTTGKIVTDDNPNEIKTLQDLTYTYDPVGNISFINDAAQQTIFFSGKRIDANCSYEYDALYRLVHATGREHNGQNPPNWDDSSRMNCPQPNDGKQMGSYSEYYEYDSVGNILKITHFNSTDILQNWTRQYQYDLYSNRLLGTDSADTSTPFYKVSPSDFADQYTYNAHGSMITMPHLQTIDWDHTEHLHHIANGTQQTWYRYDAQKQRTRKITESNGSKKKERIYLGGLEIYREWNSDTLIEKNETIQLVDGSQRMILIDHITNSANLPKDILLYRYQYSNHLGSAVLEIDDKNNIISYEEYHPYGSTAYQAVNSSIKTLAKRYRYTGMERDEETGLEYHSARYYLSWLARWLSCDPNGVKDGNNLYVYARNCPIAIKDLKGLAGQKTPSVEDVIEAETRDAAFQAGPKAQAEARQKGKSPFSLSKKAQVKLSSRQGQITMEELVENLEKNAKTNRFPGVSRRLVPELHVEDEVFLSAGDHPKPGGRNPDLGVLKEEIEGVDPRSEWNADIGKPTKKIFEKKSYDVKVGGGYVKDKKGFLAETGLTTKEVRPFSKLGMKPEPKITIGSGVKLGAFVGFQLIDIFLMYKEEKLSHYGTTPYILADKHGLYKISIREGGLFSPNEYRREYTTGDLAGKYMLINEDEFLKDKKEAEELWGYTDWKGDFVPGILRKYLLRNNDDFFNESAFHRA